MKRPRVRNCDLLKKGLKLQPVLLTSSSIPVSFLHLTVKELRRLLNVHALTLNSTHCNIHLRRKRGTGHSGLCWPMTHPAYLISRLWKTISRQLLSIREHERKVELLEECFRLQNVISLLGLLRIDKFLCELTINAPVGFSLCSAEKPFKFLANISSQFSIWFISQYAF